MELAKLGDKALPKTTQSTAIVLEEDDYIEALEKVIQKEFFPDLPKLTDHLDWIQAKSNGDLVAMREIQQKYAKKHNIKGRLNPLQTPVFAKDTPTAPSNDEDDEEALLSRVKKTGRLTKLEKKEKVPKMLEDLTVDQFHARFTSEDDASFEQITNDERIKRYEKNAWMRDEEGQQLLLKGPGANTSWKYTPQNLLMWKPDGIGTLADPVKSQSKALVPHNTRIRLDVFKKPNPKSAKKKQEQKVVYQMLKDGLSIGEIMSSARTHKIDLDDLIEPDAEKKPQAPNVNGYDFLLTPEINPGQSGDSPITTWGTLDQTPMMLAAPETPLSVGSGTGPRFNIQEDTLRDRITHSLADKARKNLASKSGQTPKRRGKQKRSRTPSLSTAGRKLQASLLRKRGVTPDNQLRASYATPSRTPRRGSGTPRRMLTPGLTPKKRKSTKEPGRTPTRTKKRKSITDGLL